MAKIKNLKFTDQTYPEVVDIVNLLAEAVNRKPHDAAKQLIVEAATARIEFPKLYKEFIDKVNALKQPQSQPAIAG